MGPGDVVGDRFEIEWLAAAGGMGRVFRARDRQSGEPVAVKVLLGGQRTNLERFMRETRLLEGLSQPSQPHPQSGPPTGPIGPTGIVRYIAHGLTPSDEPYLVMEWLDGEDLGSRLARQRLTVDESLTLARQAATALGEAHARGIIHRDLKPKNLFLVGGRIDRVKLLDFGIARAAGVAQMTQAGVLVGTPGYMAPEQCKSAQDLDARVDVYALGCVLFECLTGRPAFKAQHAMAVLVKILFEETPRVCDVRPEVPPDLDALVRRMMAKDREERPYDGAAAARALEVIGGLSSHAGEASHLAAHEPPRISSEEARTTALTRGEQRMLSVILIGRPRAPEEAQTEQALLREVAAFGGRLERLIDGSRVVTLWGEQMATDQAALAARCALTLQRHCPGHWLSLATGYGEVTGRIPVSDAIDRAAGMLLRETPSPAGGVPEMAYVLLDEVTAGLLDARFEVGESEAGLVLRGLRELPQGMRTLLGRPTSCVGRDRELGMLEQMRAGLREESLAQAVLVMAPAGMGKSRLVHEFLGRLKRQGEAVSVWVGRGDALATDSAFGLLGQVIRDACGIHEGEPLARRQDKLVGRVAAYMASSSSEEHRRRVAAFLGELAGVPFSDGDDAPLKAARKDPLLMNQQMRVAWIDFLRAACTVSVPPLGPPVLILEDLHWADLPTVRFVDTALRDLRDLPWMVLALGRPEVQERFPQLWSGRAVQVIQLKPLGRRAGERLIRQVLGDEVGPDTMDRLLDRADGHPFYLEELIRATARLHDGALPETVIAMVQSRLTALDEEARRVLRAASVFGEVFWPGAVAELLGGERLGNDAPPEWFEEVLGSLVEQEVLVQLPESQFPGETEYAFRHALLREGAYAMLVEEDRALGHRLAGAWLQEHGEGDAIVLAEHFARGRQPGRAVEFYRHAAEQALVAGDMAAATTHAQRALACGPPEALRLDLLGLLCESALWQMQWDTTTGVYEEVLRLARPGGVPWARAVTIKLTKTMLQHRTEELLGIVDVIREVTPDVEALGSTVFAMSAGGYYLDEIGRIEAADRLFEQMRALAAPVAQQEPMAWGWVHVVASRRAGLLKEDPWEGKTLGEMAQTCFREVHHHRGHVFARMFTAISLWRLGALEHAEAELRSLPVGDQTLGTGLSYVWFALLGVMADRGALAEARSEAERMLEMARARQIPAEEGRVLSALAEILRRQGELEAAETAARAAGVQLAALLPEHVTATATLGAILLAQGRADAALERVEEAWRCHRALGACGFSRELFLRLTRVECLHATGDPAGARAALEEACAILRTRAERIPDAEYRRGFLALPEHARLLALAGA